LALAACRTGGDGVDLAGSSGKETVGPEGPEDKPKRPDLAGLDNDLNLHLLPGDALRDTTIERSVGETDQGAGVAARVSIDGRSFYAGRVLRSGEGARFEIIRVTVGVTQVLASRSLDVWPDALRLTVYGSGLYLGTDAGSPLVEARDGALGDAGRAALLGAPAVAATPRVTDLATPEGRIPWLVTGVIESRPSRDKQHTFPIKLVATDVRGPGKSTYDMTYDLVNYGHLTARSLRCDGEGTRTGRELKLTWKNCLLVPTGEENPTTCTLTVKLSGKKGSGRASCSHYGPKGDDHYVADVTISE